MKESEAWRRLAQRIADDRRSVSGLCYETLEMRWDGEITGEMREQMKSRIRQHMNVQRSLRELDSWPNDMYFCPAGERGPRVIAAELLALEAEEEGR